MAFTQPWDFGDTTFVISGRKMYVNRITLAMSSEVFKAMFTSDFQEKTMTEIPLPDKKFGDFLDLMLVLHPHINKCVDDTNVEHILPLAHEYQIQPIVQQCETVLVKQPPSIHNLVLADRYFLTDLRQVCIPHARGVPYSQLEQDPEFNMLEKDTLFEVFQYKLREAKVLSKGVIYKLVTEPPSIQNMFLAEEHEIPEVYENCMKYLRQTPILKLKAEAGFTEIKPDILVEVLLHKHENLVKQVGHITSWGELDQRAGLRYTVCTNTDVGEHSKSSHKKCMRCQALRFSRICDVMQRY